MENMDKLIRHYVLEILCTIIIVIISIPVWKMYDKSDISKIAKTYATMDYLYLNIDKTVSLSNVKDEISVINDTNTLRGYNLVLKLKKNKTYEDTILTIDNKEYNLNNLEKEEDKGYIYYNIKDGNVVAGKDNIVVEYKNSNIDYNDVAYKIIENHKV